MRKNKSRSIIFRALAIFYMITTVLFPAQVFASGSVTGKIPVSCTAKGCKEIFQYKIYPMDDMSPNAAAESISLGDSQKGYFEIEFLTPGTYHYNVKQIKGEKSNINFDDSIYTIDVYITEDDNGNMAAEPIVYFKGSNEKKDSCQFVNTVETTSEGGSGFTPNNHDGSSIAGTVKTGDTTQIALWVTLASCTAILILIVVSKKKKK